MTEYCKIIIVDDEFLMRQGLKHMADWESKGFQIIGEASNGQEALTIIEKEKPHIILSDMVMPLLNGVDFISIVKEKYPDIQIIILSGYDDFEYVKNAMKNGAADYILKPTLNPEELLNVLQKTAKKIPGIVLKKDTCIQYEKSMERYLLGYESEVSPHKFDAIFPESCYVICGVNIKKYNANGQDMSGILYRKIEDWFAGCSKSGGMLLYLEERSAYLILNFLKKDENILCLEIEKLSEQLLLLYKRLFFIKSVTLTSVAEIKSFYQSVMVSALEKGFYFKHQPFIELEYKTVPPATPPKLDYNYFTSLLNQRRYQDAMKIFFEYIYAAVSAQMDEDQLKNQAKNVLYNFLDVLDGDEERLEVMRKDYFKRIDVTFYADDFIDALELIENELSEYILEQGSNEDVMIGKILDYISAHYNEELKLEELAQVFNFNYSYLSTYFNQRIPEGFRYVFHDAVAEEECHSIKHFKALYHLQKDMETAVTKHMSYQNIIIVGKNGKTFMNYSESLSISTQEILADDITKCAAKNPESLKFYYHKGGFSQSTKNLDVVIAVKAFSRKDEKEPFAYAYVTLSEADLKNYYSFFVTDTNDFYILDEEGKIIITNRISKRGKTLQNELLALEEVLEPMQICQSKGYMLTVFYRELPYFHFRMYGVIDNKKALGQLYETDRIIFYSILIVLVVVGIIVLVVKYSVQPLQVMARKMQKIKNGDFDEYMEPKGSNEIVELANTYNYMLDGLKLYVDTLIKTQKEKRKAEIHALQMQINPHYIYNTLTSIKWLIFQGEMEKSTKTIDAFIYLLRNTISDTKEYIKVKQEVENLKNYVCIQKTRYGDQIKTEFYVLQDCEEDLIPKMILQPFVENSFFHGFPSGQKGMIQIYFKEEYQKLAVIIQDNGIGMTEEEMQGMTQKKHEKFSGIGVKNIRERLNLLYGDRASMEIQSAKEEGTTVKICIPIEKEK